MTATLIVLAIPKPGAEREEGEYLRRVLPLLERAGGREAKRLRALEVLAGQPVCSRMLVMDFATAQAIRDLLVSPEYQALVPLRESAFARMDMLLAEALDGHQSG